MWMLYNKARQHMFEEEFLDFIIVDLEPKKIKKNPNLSVPPISILWHSASPNQTPP